MPGLSHWADRILLLSIAVSGLATIVGLAACPLTSLTVQHWFNYLSAATICVFTAACGLHAVRRAPLGAVVRRSFALLPFILMWAWLLFGPSHRVREASARTQMVNNAKYTALGIHEYHYTYRFLPQNLIDAEGVPILSWRVAILPYLEEHQLYSQFSLTEPWDRPPNAGLLEKIPFNYLSVAFPQAPHHTPWQGFVGPGTAFEPGQRLRLPSDFPDGTSNTILFVEAQQQVPWSKAADLAYGSGIPLPPLGQNYLAPGTWPFECYVCSPSFLICLADATVRSLPANTPENFLRSLIVRNDGKPLEAW